MKKLAKFLIICIILLSIFFILFKIIDIDRIIMKKIYPLKYTEYVGKYSKEYNIDSYMIYAIIKAESNFNKIAKSKSDAIGLMQIMKPTAKEIANKMDLNITEEQLFEPELNIQIGAKYFASYVEKYSKEYNIDKYMIYAIIKAESNFNEIAKSKSDAIGLMQIMEPTAKEIADKINLDVTQEQLFEPELNIQLGTKYFTSLLEKYNNNYKIAIIAYNAGIGNVDKWIEDGIIKEDGTDLENVPFKETNNYVRKILRGYEIYKWLYE